MRALAHGAIGLAILFGASNSHAKNLAISWGGNCNESSDAQSDFLQAAMLRSMSDLNAELRASGWQSKVYYDSQYSNQLSQYRPDAGPALRPAGSATDETLIQSLKDAAKELRKGDQLLLSVFTHGSGEVFLDPKNPDSGRRPVHAFCYTKKDGSIGFLPVDDPRLQRAFANLKKKGIGVGIADSSCYGGGSTPGLRKYGCVLSTTNALAPALASNSPVSLLSKIGAKFEIDKMSTTPWIKATQGAVGGVIDVMTSALRRGREGKNAGIDINNRTGELKPDGVLTLEEIYLATLLNYPKRVETAISESYNGASSPDPVQSAPQISSNAHDFQKTELIAELFDKVAHLGDPNAHYSAKQNHFSTPLYENDPLLCKLEKNPVLQIDFESHLKQAIAHSARSSDEELSRKLAEIRAWDDPIRHDEPILSRSIIPETIARRIPELKDQSTRFRALFEQLEKDDKYVRDLMKERKAEVEIKVQDLLPEETKLFLETHLEKETLARLIQEDPDIAMLMSRDPMKSIKVEFSGRKEQTSGTSLAELSRKLGALVQLTKASLKSQDDTQGYLEAWLRSFSIVTDYYYKAEEKIADMPDIKLQLEKDEALVEQIKSIDTTYKGALKTAYDQSQQLRFYDFIAAKQALAGQPDPSGCSDFVLARTKPAK